MDFKKYQEFTKQTIVKDAAPDSELTRFALGLNGEAGEVAEKVKKVLRDQGGEYTPADFRGIKDELGDVLWYVIQIARLCGFTLDDVAQSNLDKLTSRKRRGKIKGSGDNR